MVPSAVSEETRRNVHQHGRRTRQHVARLVTEVLAPAPAAGALLLVVAWRSATNPGDAFLWGVISILFASLLPIAYVLLGVRRRRLSDRHVGIRQQRRIPLLVGIASVLFGLAVLTAGGAPKLLLALVAAMAVGLMVSLAVTLFWKVSIHTAVIAGSVAILVLIFGPAFLSLAPLVVLAGWSRLELGHHTPRQVIAGAGLGALVATLVFSLLR